VSLLRLLSGKGIALSDAAVQRIKSCTDVETLDQWFGRAIGMRPGDALFAE